MSTLTIGVLALQGAFAKHAEMLVRIGVEAKEVRYPHDLEKCDGLIIPGGESTTITKQIQFIGFREKLRIFAETKPLFGTCAGLILISQEVISSPMQPFGLIDVSVERNAFGRQAESFRIDIELVLGPAPSKKFPALFIRAPRIRRCGTAVQVLAEYEGEPILVRQGHHLGATFHPELGEDPSIHYYFLSLVKASKYTERNSKFGFGPAVPAKN
jgi:5'-phosphate synthase pdxT subunit